MGNELARHSAVDVKLLGMARKSPQEIAEATGLDARFVAERISYLLESRDWLSERQQERLLLEEVAGLKDIVFEQLQAADDRSFAAVASVALKTLKLVSERLDARRKLVDSDINEITAAQARVFGKAFDRALNHIVDVLGDGLDSQIIDAAVADGLRLAVRELDGHVVSD